MKITPFPKEKSCLFSCIKSARGSCQLETAVGRDGTCHNIKQDTQAQVSHSKSSEVLHESNNAQYSVSAFGTDKKGIKYNL